MIWLCLKAIFKPDMKIAISKKIYFVHGIKEERGIFFVEPLFSHQA